jgi:hypothetical protein
MPETRPDNFDQDESDAQDNPTQNAEAENSDNVEYGPVVAPKSAFMGRELAVDEVVPMRVEAIHDDEYVLVCDEGNEKEPEPVESAGEMEETRPGGAPDQLFD